MQLLKIVVLLGLTVPSIMAADGDSTVDFAMTMMQHSPQALSNLHATPVCGQMCLFDASFRESFAPKCVHYSGTERFSCFCRSHAYQYRMDQCFRRECSKEERKLVIPF
jgi:CFEM domain